MNHIAKKLVNLIEKQDFSGARQSLYHPNCKSIEPGSEALIGIQALGEKEAKWRSGIEVINSVRCSEPIYGGRYFAIGITWQITYKGQSPTFWEELALFEVQNEKIISEQFFYTA
ncbi:MAG: SnoaL-like domain-containing protein [Chloroherpetonaceae bacterium]|nr:SnoaL-like domain-containing protein [Chloroherpetonaceae bacterium]